MHGPACTQFEEAMADYCGVDHAIGCASGSDALLLSLMALDVGRGDEVLLPSFTFFATAGAVWRLGATPVFVDIDPTTFNVACDDVSRKLTPRTKAIIPVHLFGQCADMTAIRTIAQQHDVAIVEDAAQAIGAEHRGQRAG
ncbi:MAG: DegT/DnrJ/EryC1/StrS family aminotransferase, partial [Deltaproteobacteria bacterium]|nr:DegT/DnrJ/EryC1/StrS family aminotransferase [Deltaproteobacteria bacterium]